MSMKRSTTTCKLGLLALILLAFPLTLLGAEASKKRPNFVLIMADDISADKYGCYGDPKANTPHIDQLASSGVMFRTCWATPMCSPSRSLLTTGRYPHRTGVYHNALWVSSGKRSPHNFAHDHLTFARLLRDAGYATAIAGKTMALGGKLTEPEIGFDEHCVHHGSGELPDGSMWDGQYEGKYKLPNAKPIPSRYWYPCVWQNGRLLETGPEDFGPDLYTDFVIDFMKRQKKAERPFLAYFPMNLPHTIASGGLPTTPTQGRPGHNKGGNLRQCNAYIDLLVGRIVQALDEEGLRENTILLFTSDNGDYPFGKMWATEYGARVPLVVNGPGFVKARKATDVLTEFSDILPTLLDYADVQLPEGYEVDGRSLKPFLSGDTDEHRDWVHSYIGTARMIRDQRWLLEGVDPIGGTPRGRFYDCGKSRSGKDYTEVVDSDDPAIAEARQRLQSILATIPHLDPDTPDHRAALDAYKTARYRHKVRK